MQEPCCSSAFLSNTGSASGTVGEAPTSSSIASFGSSAGGSCTATGILVSNLAAANYTDCSSD